MEYREIPYRGAPPGHRVDLFSPRIFFCNCGRQSLRLAGPNDVLGVRDYFVRPEDSTSETNSNQLLNVNGRKALSLSVIRHVELE